MKIELIEINGNQIAEVTAKDIIITETQDALDLMADCGYRGVRNIMIYEKNIIPEFFDLKTGIAGEILQKFSNYRTRLAIIGDFSKYPGKSLHDFIYESNKTGRVIFASEKYEAIEKLTVKQL
jgi:hypothetical protein